MTEFYHISQRRYTDTHVSEIQDGLIKETFEESCDWFDDYI